MSKRYTIARLNVDGKNFEILVNPEPALSFRKGKSNSISSTLVTELIFSDANKALKVSEKELEETFGTTNIHEIARKILTKGTLQLTTDQRRRMLEEKKRQIITLISRQAVDPRTKLPHPPTRIEQAFEQIRLPIDPFESVEEQANKAITLLRPIIPISIEKLNVSILIPPQYAGKSYGVVKSFGVIRNETWRNNGSYFAVLELSAGLYGSFLEKIGESTQGSAEVEIIK